MDSIFLLEEAERTSFLQQIALSFGCTYICLWSYVPQPSNCLFCMEGIYIEQTNQPMARSLFDEYRQSILIMDNGRVPGLAFMNNVPYMELKTADIQRLATTEIQQQFYQQAGIKTAVFLGCNSGEIELGISNGLQARKATDTFNIQRLNLEMEMRNLFPENFSGQVKPRELPQFIDQNRPSSSSSSLRSLSMDSTESGSLLFNIPGTSYVHEPHQETLAEQLIGLVPSVSTPAATSDQQAILGLSQIRSSRLPSIESVDAAMAKAIFSVISSPSSSSTHQLPQVNLPPFEHINQRNSAFKRYSSVLGSRAVPVAAGSQRHNMLRRALAFFRSLNLIRISRELVQTNRSSSTQLHHMIAERRRREKINESFQMLRSLLPPGTKKDKASVLSSTTKYLSSLKAQVADLSKRNHMLETKMLPQKEKEAIVEEGSSSSEGGRIEVRIRHEAASTSESRMVDLSVAVREECSMTDLVICILELLKKDKNVVLISVNTTMAQTSSPVNQIILRLKIEGDEWDESAFLEAVKRAIGDLLQ